LGVRVGVAEGVTVGVAVGNSATGVAVGAGAHAANSEMLRHTIKSKDLMFLLLPLLLVSALCRVFFEKILAWDCIPLTLYVPRDGHHPPATVVID